MATHLEAEFPKDNGGRSVALSPLADAAVGVNDHKRIALAGAMMMGVVGLVLLDRVRQSGEPSAGTRRTTSEGNQLARSSGRGSYAHCSPDAYRKYVVVSGRRRRRPGHRLCGPQYFVVFPATVHRDRVALTYLSIHMFCCSL